MNKQLLTLGGVSYTICLPHADTDYIQGKIASTREPYELEMLRDMAARLQPGQLVLDVGANIGNHSLYLACVAGAYVEAFEPNAELCEALRTSAIENGVESRLRVHQTGVSNSPGFAQFSQLNESNLGAQSLELSQEQSGIPLVTLDQFDLPTSVRMIKVDVENMELQVLRGAAAILERDHPILYVEGQTETDFAVINRLLEGLGYQFCATFNATPTHLFLHESEFVKLAQLGRYLTDMAYSSYHTTRSLTEARSQLDDANRKYRELNERFADIKLRYKEATLKYREVTSQVATLKSEREKLELQLQQAELEKKESLAEQTLELERARLGWEREKNHYDLQIERLEWERDRAEESLAQLKSQLNESRAAHNALQQRKQARLSELHLANSKYRQLTSETIPTLKQKLEAQSQRTKELYQRAEQLNQQLKQAQKLQAEAQRALAAIRSSATYRAGMRIRTAASSWSDALKLPVRLWRLRKQNQLVLTGVETAAPTALAPAAQVVDRRTLFTETLAHKAAKEIRVACIMDDFTFGSYQPECDLYQLTPESWQAELEACKPELLFIESAWRGKEDLWGSKVGHNSAELQGIVNWCKTRNIPTLFWNKEDPIHFQTFINTARQFDFVFTTDFDCVSRYKAALGHDQVFFLPFACQPKVHNPIEKYVRKDAFCFAGAYYVRYPERTRDLESFVQELPGYRPLEIYDRNFGKDDPNYQFPDAYQPYIVGTLPFTEIDKAYKGYRYAINLNSIKQSQTMFARRVYELLGSNTLTISNFSRGVRLMFGDLVVTSDSGADIKRRLEQLQDGNQIDRLRLAGLRRAMADHTYADRLNYLLERVTGKARSSELPSFAVLATAKNMDEVRCIAAHAARQQGVELSLTLVLRRGVSVADAESELQGLGCPYVVMQARSLRRKNLLELAGSDQHWIAAMMPSDYYGPHYLLDMALATRYSKAAVIGKAAWHLLTEEEGAPQVSLHNADEAYTPDRKSV